MKRIIGLPTRKPDLPTIDETILLVDKKADNIRAKIEHCDSELIKTREQLQKLTRGTPGYVSLVSKAQRILQRRKQYVSLVGNLETQSFTMESSTSGLQMANTTKNIITTMKCSVKKVNQLYKKLTFDEIDDLHEQIEDMQQTSEEIQAALIPNVAGIPEFNEDELQDELDSIFMEEDKSYLDEATMAGPGSSGQGGLGPTQPSTSRPQLSTDKSLLNSLPITKEGIVVDEFGLPIIPNQVPPDG